MSSVDLGPSSKFYHRFPGTRLCLSSSGVHVSESFRSLGCMSRMFLVWKPCLSVLFLSFSFHFRRHFRTRVHGR